MDPDRPGLRLASRAWDLSCCRHLEILGKYVFIYLAQWGNDDEQKEGNLSNMHVVSHLPPHLHTALTMLREHAMSEQRVWKQVSAITGWSVRTGMSWAFWTSVQRHRWRGSLSHSSPLLYLPACVSWPLKLKWRHGRKDGATQTRWSFQSFVSHRQVKKRARWHIRILISKIKPGGFVMLSPSSS